MYKINALRISYECFDIQSASSPQLQFFQSYSVTDRIKLRSTSNYLRMLASTSHANFSLSETLWDGKTCMCTSTYLHYSVFEEVTRKISIHLGLFRTD
jgi:hypothetical protein